MESPTLEYEKDISDGTSENNISNKSAEDNAEEMPEEFSSIQQTLDNLDGITETVPKSHSAEFEVSGRRLSGSILKKSTEEKEVSEKMPEKMPSVDQAKGILNEISDALHTKKSNDFQLASDKLVEDMVFRNSSGFDISLTEFVEAIPSVEMAEGTGSFVPADSLFPVIHDPGLESVFSKYEALKQKTIPRGEEKYLELCKIIGVAPVESFYKSLDKDGIDLSFYGVNPKGIGAMGEALFYNPYVLSLSLESNHLTHDAVYHLGEMLNINGALLELNLKGCRIGPRGAEALAKGLHSNASLLTLNLADNAITDDGLKFLIRPFTEHLTLTNINLSNNGLTQRSAIRISKPIEENSMLRELDLSWNYLNSTEGCRKLCGGILKSTSMESVNLSWNGLDELAAKYIAFCLGRSMTLERLDISNNSLNDDCVTTISKGLQKSISLKFLKLSMNPFTHEGARSLLEKLLNPKPVLEVLDIGNIMVEKDFKELLSKVQKVRAIKVILGGYRSIYEIKGPNIKELLMKRAKYVAKKRKKNKKDFGQFILKLGEKPVNRDEFEESIKGAKIKLDSDLMQEIMNAFKIKKRVDVQEMKEQYLRIFPDTTLVEKKKKGKGRKKGQKKGKAMKEKKK